MGYTSQEILTMSRRGVKFVARATSGPDGWSIMVSQSNTPGRAGQLEPLVKRDGSIRYLTRLDAVYRWAQNHGVSSIQIDVDPPLTEGNGDRRQSSLKLGAST